MKRILVVAAIFSLALGLIGSTSSAFAGGGDNDRGSQQGGGDGGPRDPRTRDGKPKTAVNIDSNDARHDWDREHGSQPGYKQVVREYHMDTTSPFAASVCGVNFVGAIRERNDFVLRANGRLYFKYSARAQADGLDSQGRPVELTLLNYEIDRIVADTPPDLGPYNGVLADWVNDHLDIVIEIKSQFLLKVKGAPGAPQLLNNWVFRATHTGVKLDRATFVVTGCAPFLDTPKSVKDDRDHDGRDRDDRDRDDRDRDGRHR